MTQYSQLVVAQEQQQPTQNQQNQTSVQQQQPQQEISTQTNSNINTNNNNINNINTNNTSNNSSKKSFTAPLTTSNQIVQTIQSAQVPTQSSGSSSSSNNNNNSNNSNNNNSNSHSNNSNNNNNNTISNNSSNYGGGSGQLLPPSASASIYNPSLPASNLYMPAAHGIAPHNSTHSGATMYPAMIPAPMSSNVYVNNVTANVNLHGWTHGAWVHPGAPSHHYIHGDIPPEQTAPVLQPMTHMPLPLAAPNNITGTTGLTNSSRGSRRGRRGGLGSNSRRSDYNVQRIHTSEDSSVSSCQSGLLDSQGNDLMQQQQQSLETQQIMAGGHATYVPQTQYGVAAHHAQYPCAYPTFFAPQSAILPTAQNSSAVQQATGAPLYFSAMPIYANSPHMYNYGYILPPVMNPADYQYMPGEEVIGDDNQTGEDGSGGAAASTIMWHDQYMYAEEYSMASEVPVAPGNDDLHMQHTNTTTTPSMLSPANYASIYDAQMHEMHHQMSAMQIYDDQQLAQMQAVLPVSGSVNQLDEELSECNMSGGGASQPAGAAIHMVPSAAIMSSGLMSLVGEGQIMHNLPTVAPPLSSSSLQQHQQHHYQHNQHHQEQYQQQEQQINQHSNDVGLMPVSESVHETTTKITLTTPSISTVPTNNIVSDSCHENLNEKNNVMTSNESLSSNSLVETNLQQQQQQQQQHLSQLHNQQLLEQQQPQIMQQQNQQHQQNNEMNVASVDYQQKQQHQQQVQTHFIIPSASQQQQQQQQQLQSIESFNSSVQYSSNNNKSNTNNEKIHKILMTDNNDFVENTEPQRSVNVGGPNINTDLHNENLDRVSKTIVTTTAAPSLQEQQMQQQSITTTATTIATIVGVTKNKQQQSLTNYGKLANSIEQPPQQQQRYSTVTRNMPSNHSININKTTTTSGISTGAGAGSFTGTNTGSGYHQSTYETQRKQNQNYQQQQSRRKYDYQHHVNATSGANYETAAGNAASGNNNNQPTKSMSWTNSSQYKKTTNSVAVTATPSSSGYATANASHINQQHSNATNNNNKNSNNNVKEISSSSSATPTYGSLNNRTYTNQQHHNYHQHHQQLQQHSQSRNYINTKVQSTSIANNAIPTTKSNQLFGNNTLERKNSQNQLIATLENTKVVTTDQIINGLRNQTTTAATMLGVGVDGNTGGARTTTPIATATATTSVTVVPNQLPQSQLNTMAASTTATAITRTTTTIVNTNNNNISKTLLTNKQYPPGFANKKFITQQQSMINNNNSNTQQQSITAITTTASSVTTSASNISNTNNATQMPTINLAPPATNLGSSTTQSSGRPLWASLFNNSNVNVNSINNKITMATTTAVTATTTTTTASTVANNNLSSNSSNSNSNLSGSFAKKPIAKVAPYEGVTPTLPASSSVLTPGAMSYSAASAQGLSSDNVSSSIQFKRSSNDINNTTITTNSQRTAALNNVDEYSIKFAEFLTRYKIDLSPVSLRPRGLTNRSNYCYINATLQALLGCAPFCNLLRSIPKQAIALTEIKMPTVNAMVNFMSNFSNLPMSLRLRTTKGGSKGKDDLGSDLQCDIAFEPTEIYKLWNDSRDEHVEGRQEDAEEFLSYILNKLNDELLEVLKTISKPTSEHSNQLENEEGGNAWQMICNNRNKGSVTRQTDFGRTPLSDLFRGELRSHLQREGEYSTMVIQPFFTLPLYIEKAASVKEALDILVGRDQLEGVTGSKSKQEVAAWQQINLEKLPIVLILHLKCFDYRSDGCTKILKKVEFPVELKIDAKILASKKYSQKQRMYRLFAVVYHDGKEATKGHYITDVYHTGYGSWLRYDDSSVKPISENHVLTPRSPRVPYLLYYRRYDTMAISNSHNNSNISNGK